MLFRSQGRLPRSMWDGCITIPRKKKQQSDTTWRCCENVCLCQTPGYPLPSLTQTLISSAVISGASWSLIKSLINYLVDQKFSGPLLLHRASTAAKPLELNTRIEANTSRSEKCTLQPQMCICTHSHRKTHRLWWSQIRVQGWGWLAGVQLINNLVFGRLCLPPSVGD